MKGPGHEGGRGLLIAKHACPASGGDARSFWVISR
jgi:hypothetical protein